MKFQKSLLAIVVLLVSTLLVACSAATAATPKEENVQTLIVGPEKVECTGLIVSQECLQVKDSQAETEWRWFYDSIEGFTYEPGYLYELRVRTETIENPPADGSSIRWILVEEVSKTEVELPAQQEPPVTLTSRPWTLHSFGVDVEAIAGVEVTLNLGADGTASGNSSINRYNGTFQTDGETITFSPLAGTKMGGDPELMVQETEYLAQLAQAVTYKVEGPTTVSGARLTLFDGEGNTLLIFYGPRE